MFNQRSPTNRRGFVIAKAAEMVSQPRLGFAGAHRRSNLQCLFWFPRLLVLESVLVPMPLLLLLVNQQLINSLLKYI